jgi:hypothetical protein
MPKSAARDTSIKTYRSKRDFAITAEPAAQIAKLGSDTSRPIR